MIESRDRSQDDPCGNNSLQVCDAVRVSVLVRPCINWLPKFESSVKNPLWNWSIMMECSALEDGVRCTPKLA